MTPLSKLKLRGDAPETPKSVRKRISKKIEQKLESSSSEEEESDEEEVDSDDEEIKPIDKPAANRTGCVLTSSIFRVFFSSLKSSNDFKKIIVIHNAYSLIVAVWRSSDVALLRLKTHKRKFFLQKLQ